LLTLHTRPFRAFYSCPLKNCLSFKTNSVSYYSRIEKGFPSSSLFFNLSVKL
jgi:hypothetical protein